MIAATSQPVDGTPSGEAYATSARMAREWLESVPAIAWQTDAFARIVDRNRHWFEYTGRSPETASAGDWLEVIHPEDRGRAADAVRGAVERGTMLDAEFRVRRWDGAYRWFIARAAPVRDERGHVTGWMGIATDIEDRKRAESALREADRRKNEFLGALSHELRNPLAPLTSAIYILEHTEPGSSRAQNARGVIARQTTHLARLVDDLLDVTRIVRGKIELRRTPIDLGEILRRTADDHAALMEDRGIRLTVDLPPHPMPIHADATRIAQVLGNVLLNAAKFTPRGGEVRVSASARPDLYEVHVRDDGVGISPELVPHLFEPFAQGPQGLARTAGGLGLGLALVRGLTELHGGTVAVHSDGPGLGTEVTIALPAA